MGKILLFYKYIDIQYPEQVKKWQFEICQSLGLRGRIILAHEGINGTVGGSPEATQAYVEAMNAHPLFGNIDFKEAPGGSDYFPRLRIVVKKEIVHLGIDPTQLSAKNAGKHLTPAQAHELIKQKPDNLVILDGRNNFEARIGKFEGAITPDINYFREFPAYIDQHAEQFKDKQVLMYCTGGIRCERASAYLKEKGITQEVYQIEGGIDRYVQAYPDGFFRGKNYVFDARVAVKVNDDILTSCDICQTPYDDYTNCLNAECNKQYIACEPCITVLENCCSTQCQRLVEAKNVVVRKIPKKLGPEKQCLI